MMETEDWQWVEMDGERPAAGVLSSRTLWLRYGADATNRNRMRAEKNLQRSFSVKAFDRPGGLSFDRISSINNVEQAIKHNQNASVAMPPSIHWPHFLAGSQSTPPIHRCAALFPTLRSKHGGMHSDIRSIF